MYKFLLGISVVSVSALEVTPVQKVVQMLGDMAAKGKKEKHEEEVSFAAFSQWCGDVSAEKTNLIDNAKVAMNELDALIAKSEADAQALADSIAVLDATIGDLTNQKQEATDLRAKENKDFLVQQTDYEESIDALGRAMSVLKQQNYDRKQAETALLQVQSMSLMSSSDKKKLLSLMGNKQGPTAEREVANSYEFQSGGIISMLETLETKFVEELRGLQKEEAQTKHAFNLLEQSLTDQIANATKQMDAETAQRHKKLEIAGKAKADLADTTASHDSDVKYLSDLKSECSIKSKEFEDRQVLRSEEIVAINKAIEILSSGAVAGNADTYLPSFVQKKNSFLQVRTKSTFTNDKLNKITEFLQNAAQKSGSKELALMAARVSDSPFAKVSKMIEALITKLMEEANAEAEQHGWCTTELAANKMTREDKSAAADALRSEIDSLKAEIAEQTQKALDLTTAVKESDAAVREATKVRSEEKVKNAQTIKDAKIAQEAVAQALTVLKEFYAKASEAKSFLQQPSADAPGTWDKKYTGMQGSSTGVVGMIEVIQSDFVRLETETASEEATSSKEHQQFLDDSAEDKAVKEAEISHLNKRRARNENNKNSAQKELNITEEELGAAQEYFEKLKPTCMPEPVSWEERKAKREEEIASLKEALTILDQ